MRASLYNTKAKRQTVSLTVNSDLFAKARAAGINASRVAEDALATALAAREAARIRDEIRQDLEAMDAYVEKHGDFAAMMRAHYEAEADGDR